MTFGRSSVISFIEKTWFVWWILAILFILRWFNVFLSDADEEIAFEAVEPAKGKSAGASKQIPSGTAGSLLT
jgi:hypothetical protein